MLAEISRRLTTSGNNVGFAHAQLAWNIERDNGAKIFVFNIVLKIQSNC